MRIENVLIEKTQSDQAKIDDKNTNWTKMKLHKSQFCAPLWGNRNENKINSDDDKTNKRI